MKVIYFSSLCTSEKFNSIFTNLKTSPGQQCLKYHTLLAEGFVKNGVEVETVSALPVTMANYSGKYIKSSTEIKNGVKYNYLPIINLPVIKRLFVILSTFNKTLKLCRKDKDVILIADVLNISIVMGLRLALLLKKRKNIGIITDLPDLIPGQDKKIIAKINNFLMNSFEYYVFLTKKMSDMVKCSPDKYTVIEGQVDINMQDIDVDVSGKYKKKVCIYAGSLHKCYGIDYLIEGFALADIKDAELHIYGNGDYVSEIEELCKKFPSIKYMGVKPNAEIVAEELKATLLINPRHSSGEYVEYSFPSKTLEYMVSGTPTLTTDLAGMPSEYHDYVFIIKDETAKGIAKDLKQILSKTPEELNDFGKNAKKFVLHDKNNLVASRKILELIEKKN